MKVSLRAARGVIKDSLKHIVNRQSILEYWLCSEQWWLY